MELLHILNGDATKQLFKHSKLEGDICVWREALVTGPLESEVASRTFWETRASYHNAERAYYKPPSEAIVDKASYQLTIEGFDKISKINEYEEVILWFEHDLFCQVNLLALLSWINKNSPLKTIISLVCIDHFDGIVNFRGLGQLKPENFPSLFQDRTTLSTKDIAFGDFCWRAFSDKDPLNLSKLTTTAFPPVFPFLKKAIINHLMRFPSVLDGLNIIERNILQKLADQPMSSFQLVGQLLQDDHDFGFGDLQYFEIINNMSHLLENKNGNLILNSNGSAVFFGNKNNLSFIDKPINIGGANGKKYFWDNKRGLRQ